MGKNAAASASERADASQPWWLVDFRPNDAYDWHRLSALVRLAGHVALIGIGTFTIDHMMLMWHDQG